MGPLTKKRRAEEEAEKDKDAKIEDLEEKVARLEALVKHQAENGNTFYSSTNCKLAQWHGGTIPEDGIPARHIVEIVEQARQLDFSPRLNTSSYVNVVSEPEEKHVAQLGAEVNLADASVYPASVRMHDMVVNAIAKLWHAPEPEGEKKNYCGAGTVGSTEACLLAGLALKFRWRKWYAEQKGLDAGSPTVLAVRPNLVISTCYQAAWEKFFRYFEVEAKFVKPKLVGNKSMVADPKELAELCDDKTIGVVTILGNHYNGNYDPVWEVDKELTRINKEKGLQVGIHVDAASGGFIAPFQKEMEDKPFDFRLDNVMSMSTSGHKFGESVCGTGWVVFRQRQNLAEHIAVSVTYLGGHSDSMTLNFSRPASGVYVQFYKLLRLGWNGYRQKVENQMEVAAFLRDFLRKQVYHDPNNPDCKNNGKPRFQILDGGNTCCLPVVAARLNPDLDLKYDDIDLQHALSESHWYVSGYTLGFENFSNNGIEESLFTDANKDCSMFRIVCKSNLTLGLAENLTEQFEMVLPLLDSLEDGYRSMHTAKEAFGEERDALAAAGSVAGAATAIMAANKWLRKTAKEKRGGSGHRRRASLHTAC